MRSALALILCGLALLSACQSEYIRIGSASRALRLLGADDITATSSSAAHADLVRQNLSGRWSTFGMVQSLSNGGGASPQLFNGDYPATTLPLDPYASGFDLPIQAHINGTPTDTLQVRSKPATWTVELMEQAAGDDLTLVGTFVAAQADAIIKSQFKAQKQHDVDRSPLTFTVHWELGGTSAGSTVDEQYDQVIYVESSDAYAL